MFFIRWCLSSWSSSWCLSKSRDQSRKLTVRDSETVYGVICKGNELRILNDQFSRAISKWSMHVFLEQWFKFWADSFWNNVHCVRGTRVPITRNLLNLHQIIRQLDAEKTILFSQKPYFCAGGALTLSEPQKVLALCEILHLRGVFFETIH